MPFEESEWHLNERLQQHRELQNERANAAKETSTSAEFSEWPRTAEDPEQEPQFAAQVVP
jgi:hypothetical protein